MDGGRFESSLAERRSGRGIDFGNSDADEDVGYVKRSKPSRVGCEPKRSREEANPSLRKELDGGVCKVDVRGDELLYMFSSVRTSKASERVTNSPAAVAQTRSRRRIKPWGLVLMAPRADNFERVNASSGVIVFHHQTRMPAIWKLGEHHSSQSDLIIDGVHIPTQDSRSVKKILGCITLFLIRELPEHCL